MRPLFSVAKPVVVFIVLVSCTLYPSRCVGQAWTPPRGEGEYATVFQDLYTAKHTLGDGSRVDAGHVSLLGLVNSVDVGITDRLAVTAAVPLGMGIYNGRTPHLLPIDDGNFHGGLQDFGIGVRYNLISRHLMLTPFVLSTLPMTHYQHFAHSAIGSDAWEFRMGFTAGQRLQNHFRNAYFQVAYSYSIAEEFMNIRPNRHRFNAEFGYFVTRQLAVRVLSLSQFMTTGLNIPNDYPVRTPTNPLWQQHDRISKVDFFDVGGGLSYGLTPTINIFGSLLTMPWGTNGHALKTGASVGISWSFHTPWARPRLPDRLVSNSQTWQAQLNQPPQMQCAH
ncbi:MAG TPA: hypothetical protein VNZ03_07985 [Terriglobales bacterium]|nr:hypothetical protein [Terriglobales bacterium]